MPAIPTYQPQVRPSAPRPAALGVESFGAARGRQTAAIGEAFGGAANAAGGAFLRLEEERKKEQAREDATAAFDAEVRAQTAWLDISSAMQKRAGTDAKGLAEETAAWWDDATREFGTGLRPDAQRVFLQQMARAKLQGTRQMLAYQEDQLEKAHDAAWESSKASVISAATRDPSPDSIRKAEAELRKRNAYQLQRKGLGGDPAMLEQLNEADLTRLHTNVINQLLNMPGGGLLARTYYASHKGSIAGEQKDEIEGKVRVAALNDEAERLAAQYRGLDPDEAMAKLEKIGDEKLRTAARQAWSIDFNMRQSAKNHREKQASDVVWTIVMRGDNPTAAQVSAMSVSEQWRYRAYREAQSEGVVDKTTGMIHAPVDDWDMLRRLEASIDSGDLRTQAQLREYAPMVRAETFRRLSNTIADRQKLNPADVRRAFLERKGLTATKLYGDQKALEEFNQFSRYVNQQLAASGRPQDLAEWANRWIAEGTDPEAFWGFRGQPFSRATQRGVADRFLFKMPADQESLDAVHTAFGFAEQVLPAGSLPTGDHAAREFYSRAYIPARDWVEGHIDVLANLEGEPWDKREKIMDDLTNVAAALVAAGKPLTQETLMQAIDQLVPQGGEQ